MPARIPTTKIDGPPQTAVLATSRAAATIAWGTSVLLHGVCMALLVAGRGCAPAGAGLGQGEVVRTVGIVLKPAAVDTPSVEEPNPATETAIDPAANAAPQQTPSETQPNLPQPSLPLPKLPTMSLPAIGSGLPKTESANQQLSGIATAASRAPANRASVPPGTVSFFNVRASARTYVFVIDMSDSMANHRALSHAKTELVAALNQLQPDQRFQIIFYNDDPVLFTNRQDQQGLSPADPINLNLARRFVEQQSSSGGTDHFPALLAALRERPDVLFLLTDADEPQLTFRDTQEVKKLAGGRTTIHCVEFGRTADFGVENFLRQLARENGGTHRYRNITTLEP